MAQQSTVNPNCVQLAQLTQLGSANFGTDTRALYLKLFSGEMLKGFQHNTIARDMIMKRTLKNGKSLQFVYTGRTKVSSIRLATAFWVTPMVHRRWLRRPSRSMIS